MRPAFAETVEVNKVLFTVANESWTFRDMQVYESVLNEVFKKKRLTDYSKSDFNDFLLSRLGQKEAKTFSLTADKTKMSDAVRKKLNMYTGSELDRELEAISKAISIIEIKESQHKDQARFNSWFDLMKRKYVVKMKSFDFN